MSTADLIKTVLEFAAIVFTVWAIFHEDRFIAFEDKIAAHIRRKKLKVVTGGKFSKVNSTEKI